MKNSFFNLKARSKKIILIDENENLITEQEMYKKESKI